MIKDIPTHDEFDSAAKAQFDFAWDIAISFLLTLDDAGNYVAIEADDERSYWEAARQRILTSLTIAQQGTEFALKAKLVAISPYLLIAGNPSDWPKDAQGQGVSFADFRTIDAQDLIKVHNTAAPHALDEAFTTLFDGLRKLRNKAMHTVDRQLTVSAEEVIIALLEVHEHLYPQERWVDTRSEFLHNSPDMQVYLATDHIAGKLAKEFLTVFNILKPAQIQKFFKIDKRQRLYMCPECKYEGDRYEEIEPRYAVLRPNEPDSENLYCFVCNELYPVSRTDCNTGDCPGNAISVEYDCCCTCGKSQM